ncbi:tubulin binding cofactor A [Dictyocaulus viviparus]|uniref:Tubulin-specific chaperone A n=1 Tax=Dictyocaulus viviparus TaxID=29172 RepID=A0A0D8XJ51_DICVI|nr:tubulin binding cofactor A [Dictyocaulus viviparus]
MHSGVLKIHSAFKMTDPAALKQIKIQTGVVKRLIKEHACYTKEVEKETQKIEKMKAEAQNEDDEYAIKKAGQVLQETHGMINDTARRCITATEELRKLIDSCTVEECQELNEAKAQIEAALAINAA